MRHERQNEAGAVSPASAGSAGYAARDRIWYRRKGETYIHVAYVRTAKERVIEVTRHEPDDVGYILGRDCYWLDRDEIEVLEVEHPAA